MSTKFVVFAGNKGNICRSRQLNNRYYLSERPPVKAAGTVLSIKEYEIDRLLKATKISITNRAKCFDGIMQIILYYEQISISEALGSYPTRKFAPNQDKIIDFLREVWGEWIAAGQLTRSILRQQDAKAYMALANWLRTNELPSDLRIPTKSEVIDQSLIKDPGHLKASARLVHAIDGRTHRARRKGAGPVPK